MEAVDIFHHSTTGLSDSITTDNGVDRNSKILLSPLSIVSEFLIEELNLTHEGALAFVVPSTLDGGHHLFHGALKRWLFAMIDKHPNTIERLILRGLTKGFRSIVAVVLGQAGCDDANVISVHPSVIFCELGLLQIKDVTTSELHDMSLHLLVILLLFSLGDHSGSVGTGVNPNLLATGTQLILPTVRSDHRATFIAMSDDILLLVAAELEESVYQVELGRPSRLLLGLLGIIRDISSGGTGIIYHLILL